MVSSLGPSAPISTTQKSLTTAKPAAEKGEIGEIGEQRSVVSDEASQEPAQGIAQNNLAQKNLAQNNLTQKNLSSHVDIRYQSQSSLSFSSSSIEKYQAIGETQQNPAATKILSFIESQLQRDISEGSSVEALSERLQSGAEGFAKGFNEGYEDVQALGWSNTEVNSGLQDTFNQVSAGLQALAEKYGLSAPEGLESPIAATNESQGENGSTLEPIQADVPGFAPPAGGKHLEISSTVKSPNQQVNNVQAAYYQQQSAVLSDAVGDSSVSAHAAYQSYSFQLHTQDGDVVTINASTQFGLAIAAEGGDYAASGSLEELFSFSVEGELDEDELSAINDLLGQINDVADMFFNNDVYGAYEQALEIGFNSEEIAGFALNLSQGSVTRVENTYKEVQDNYAPAANTPPSHAALIGEFSEKLDILQQGLAQMGSDISLLEKLFELTNENSEERLAIDEAVDGDTVDNKPLDKESVNKEAANNELSNSEKFALLWERLRTKAEA